MFSGFTTFKTTFPNPPKQELSLPEYVPTNRQPIEFASMIRPMISNIPALGNVDPIDEEFKEDSEIEGDFSKSSRESRIILPIDYLKASRPVPRRILLGQKTKSNSINPGSE